MNYCTENFIAEDFIADVSEIMQPFLRMHMCYNSQKYARQVIDALLYYYFIETRLCKRPAIVSVTWDRAARSLEVKFGEDFEKEIALLGEEQ